MATAHISPFLSNQIYVHLFLWLMLGNPLIFPHSDIFLVHLKKRKLKILWAFPRNGLSWDSEPCFLLNKTGLLWAGCALHTFSWYQWEKQIFHLPMIKHIKSHRNVQYAGLNYIGVCLNRREKTCLFMSPGKDISEEKLWCLSNHIIDSTVGPRNPGLVSGMNTEHF